MSGGCQVTVYERHDGGRWGTSYNRARPCGARVVREGLCARHLADKRRLSRRGAA